MCLSSEWFHQYVHRRHCCQGASWSTLSYVTLSWPDADVWYHLTTCCLYITSLPYTFVNCQRISDTDTLYPQKAYNSSEFKARPVFQVGNYVELMHLCSLLTYALNFVTQPKHSSPLLYISTAFEISISSASRIIGLVNYFWTTLIHFGFTFLLKLKCACICLFVLFITLQYWLLPTWYTHSLFLQVDVLSMFVQFLWSCICNYSVLQVLLIIPLKTQNSLNCVSEMACASTWVLMC